MACILLGMNNEIKQGDKVQIKLDHYDLMIGVVERVIKVSVPFGPESSNPNDWTYHVKVDSNHPRNSGVFQLKLTNILTKT